MADAGPPRHAVESDDEDEFNPLSPKQPPPKHDLNFEIVNAGKSTREALIFASAEAGRWVLLTNHPRLPVETFARIWARGADLGEQVGAINVNKKPVCNKSLFCSLLILMVQVGMIFNPEWTDAIVIVSEALTRLPVWAQYPYAEYVLDQFKPTK